MSAKISQLSTLTKISGDELVLVAYQGVNYSVRSADLLKLITKASLGLSNADNTSDEAKPLSQAARNALDQKADKQHTHDYTELANTVLSQIARDLENYSQTGHKHSAQDITNLEEILNQKAAKQHTHTVESIENLQTVLNEFAQTLTNALNQNAVQIGLREW